MIARYLRTALLVWACEAVLARWSSDRQTLIDLAVSLLGLVLSGALPLAVALTTRGALRDIAMACACTTPLAVVAVGILLVPATSVAPLFGTLLAALVAVLLVGGAAVAAWHHRRGFPGAWTVPLVVAACAGLAWMLEAQRLPPGDTCVRLALCWAAAGAVAGGRLGGGSDPRIRVPGLGFAVLLLVGVGVARFPAPEFAPDWQFADPAPSRSAPSDATESLPDVILLGVDALRDDLAAELRAWQRLAAEGTEFAEAQAASPWTLPSMATLMTGLPPWSHGAGSGEDGVLLGLSPETPTLAERALERGYDTAALVHNPVLSPGLGFRRGFQVWDSAAVRTAWALPRVQSALEARPTLAHLATALGLLGRPRFHDATEIAARAEQVLAARRADHPLLLWAHFHDLHLPYRDALALEGPELRRRLQLERGDLDGLRADAWWASEAGRETLQAASRHQAAAVDAALLRILDALGPAPERGRMVVLYADHGEEFFEHGDLGHGHAYYQEVLGVPLVIRGLPGRLAGEVEDQVVSHLDLAATLFDTVGAPPPDGPPGQLLGATPKARLVYSEGLMSAARADGGRSWAVRDGRWKYLFLADGSIQVYDLLADPGETEDLYPQRADAAEALPQRPPRVARPSSRGGPEIDRVRNALGYSSDE